MSDKSSETPSALVEAMEAALKEPGSAIQINKPSARLLLDALAAAESRQRELERVAANHDELSRRLTNETTKCVAAEARINNWRNWAQFVYLKSGKPEGTDEELRARVCETHDAEMALSRERTDHA